MKATKKAETDTPSDDSVSESYSEDSAESIAAAEDEVINYFA
jgi:hypothetical protein